MKLKPKRVEGWEQRLQRVIDSTRARRYELGASDCFWLACEVESALLSAQSRWSLWERRYASTAEALALIAERGGFVRAFSDFFGSEPVDPSQARRGDIGMAKDDYGMNHLVICLGEAAAAYAENGLTFISMEACSVAWRIG